jgi:putative transposase
VKVLAVIALKAQYRLDVLLDVAGLARSTFFYRQAQLRRPDPKAALKAAVTSAFENNHRRYGHRRVHRVLVEAGWRVAWLARRSSTVKRSCVDRTRRPR